MARIFFSLRVSVFCNKLWIRENVCTVPVYTTAQCGTHKSTLCVSVFVCLCVLWVTLLEFFAFARFPPNKSSTHTRAKIGAKPHLGTLPPLKQIRPQRLIKNSKSKARLPQTRGYRRGEPFLATPALSTMNSYKTERCFSTRTQWRAWHFLSISPTPFSRVLNGALMLYSS